MMIHDLARRSPSVLLAAVVAAAACGPAAGAAAADEWPVGVARAVITPTERMWMSGYGARDHAAEGTLHDLHVKAIAFGEPALVLVTLDLLAIDHDTSARIRDRLRTEHGLAGERVAINCSHTHCGPFVGAALPVVDLLEPDDRAAVDRYEARLVDTVVECVGRALVARRPARVSWGRGTCDVAVNRRENKEPDVLASRAAGQPLRGPFDHDVPVLAFHADDGGLIAAVFGYACHATALDFYYWCGDYPGFACLEFERRHPGATALFWAGCGGDQNPLPRRSVELAEAYGRRLADAVDAVLAGGRLAPVTGRPTAAAAEIELAYGAIPDRAAWAAAAETGEKLEKPRARRMLARLTAEGRLPTTYPHYPVQVWSLGPGGPTWVFLGGEVVVDYALRLKRELGPGPVWVAGYTNDVMCYIPSRRVLDEGGYEGATSMKYYGRPAPWAADVEERVVAAVRRLARPAPDPQGSRVP
jgi:neutral ceramidase